ncbi:hypothetical protein PRVXT_002050 [Proteinivorax tanatarense]|uniref:Uncharacterized protein n=1 Tax=Proteinivorax tanatarense TaxID=1260629 RepID=A0AAU7VJ84_9FIRM
MREIIILLSVILVGAAIIGALIYFYFWFCFNGKESKWFLVNAKVVEGKQWDYRRIQLFVIFLSLLLIVGIGGLIQLQEYLFLLLNSRFFWVLSGVLAALISIIIKIVAWKKEVVEIDESHQKKLTYLAFFYVILLISLVSIGAIYNSYKVTTYGEVISDLLEEHDKVSKIEINKVSMPIDLDAATYYTTIKGSELENILKKPADMKLFKSEFIPYNDDSYEILVYTKEDNNVVTAELSKKWIIIDEEYQILSENLLYKIVTESDWQWKKK